MYHVSKISVQPKMPFFWFSGLTEKKTEIKIPIIETEIESKCMYMHYQKISEFFSLKISQKKFKNTIRFTSEKAMLCRPNQ